MNHLGGLFISFEGIEGAGKSTQIRLLMEWISSLDRKVKVVREPGGTPVGERIRELLLRSTDESLDPRAELCLYEAARSQLVRQVIEPALAEGMVVLADRFADASVAYQGGGRRLGLARVRSLNRLATRGLVPRRTYLLDLEPRLGLDRIRVGRGPSALDRLESEPLAFHRRVRRTYLSMASKEPDRFLVLDAARPEGALFCQLRTDLKRLL